MIILGAIVPWIGNLLYLSRALPVTGLDLTPIAFTVSGACFTFGIYRYRLFGLVPVARDMVVDSMDDGVIVLDAQRRLVDLNAAAERYTGCNHTVSAGRSTKWWRGGPKRSMKIVRSPRDNRPSSRSNRARGISK